MGMRTWQSISVPPWTHEDLLLKKLAWSRAETSQGLPGQRIFLGSSDTRDRSC